MERAFRAEGGSACERRGLRSRNACWMLCLLSLVSACGREAARPDAGRAPANLNDVDPARLAPSLLHDEAEMKQYLAAFPLSDYKVYKVDTIGSFYLDDIDDSIKKWLRKGVVWEDSLNFDISKYSRPGTTAIDAGAHVGTHTLVMSKGVGPSGRVYAFEPQKKIFRELVRNLELNGVRNAIPLRFALGDQPGIVEMNVATTGSEGSTSVGKGGDRVELRTIDSFAFKNVSFMKIDVEGFEDQVLAGASQTIRSQHPALLVEIQGGFDPLHASAEIKQRIEHTIGVLKGFGYEVVRSTVHDYLATYPGPRH